jgi:hypothetical protein
MRFFGFDKSEAHNYTGTRSKHGIITYVNQQIELEIKIR